MNKWTRLLTIVLAALITTIGMASLAFAQDPDECYPVPVEDCELPTAEEPDPDLGVLPDTDEGEDEDDEPGAAVVPDQTSPGTDVIAAGQQPTVQAQTALAQTGMPAAALLAAVGVTLGSGVVLLLTTRRRAS